MKTNIFDNVNHCEPKGSAGATIPDAAPRRRGLFNSGILLIWHAILVLALLFTGTLRLSAADEPAPATKNGTPDFPAAMEQARRGQPEELLSLTRMLAKQPALLPARKSLGQYHQYLKDTNVFIQYFGVQVIAGLKDKSSAESLRQFIMDVERRKADIERLPRMEGAALGMASMTALVAYGDLDDDFSVSVKFLASMLNHDQPMEWGGGVAHSALAKKGRPGLQALLEEARQPLKDDDRQISFLGSAIGEIKDPQFAVDLYVASKDPKCHKMVRNRAVFSLGAMAKQSSEAEQLLINLAEDEKFDQRSLAVQEVGNLNTPRALGVLLKLEKSSFNDTNTLQKALLSCNATNRIPIVFESILSPKTPRTEKGRLWGMLASQGLQSYEKELQKCLKMSDTNGVPINDLRVAVWMKLYQQTRTYNPVELSFDSEENFAKVASAIITEVHRRVYSKYRDAGKHSDAQMQQMALDEAKTFVTKWEAPKQEL